MDDEGTHYNQIIFLVTDEEMAEFQQLLNQEPRDMPKLQKLFEKPTIFSEDF
jgi:hypothetical protein